MKNNQIQTTTDNLPSVKITKTKFLETYKPSNAFRLFNKVTTVKKAIALNGNAPSVGDILRAYGDSFIEAYIKIWLINLNDSLGLKRPLTESQMDETAMTIVEDYKNLNLSDINLVFKGMKTGEFGEYYESLNMAKVIGIFKEYFENRMTVAANMSLDNHLAGKQEGERSKERAQNKMDSAEKRFKDDKHEEDLQKMVDKFKVKD